MTAVPNEKLYTVADIEALPEGQRAELIDGFRIRVSDLL